MPDLISPRLAAIAAARTSFKAAQKGTARCENLIETSTDKEVRAAIIELRIAAQCATTAMKLLHDVLHERKGSR